MKELKNWIYKFLADDDEFLNTSVFEKSISLYFTPVSNNFVTTIINGSGRAAHYKVNPGEHQYNYIVRQVSEITNKDSSVWFYYTVIDNAVGRLNDIWECNYEYSLDYPLEKFETEPAKEGGVSYLGLLGKNKSWLLLHTYDAGESFEITFHGNEDLVKGLENILTKSN